MRLCFRALVTSFTILILTACGGSGDSVSRDGGGGGGGGTDTVSFTISIGLTNEAGETTNVLSANDTLTATAILVASDGSSAANQDISFSFTEQGLANFVNSVSIVRTDAAGVAAVELSAGVSAGSGFVVAAFSNEVNSQIGFNSTGREATIVEPASLEFFTSSIQLASSGSDQIELIAVVKNEQNVLLEGVDVSFSADSGELQITQGTTAADGTARAILTSTTNQQNRSINATARTGEFTEQLTIDVVGTEININGPSSVIINDPVPLTIIVADSDGNGIPNQIVSLSSQNGMLSSIAPVTGATGQVQVNYTANTSGQDVVTATSLNAVSSITLTVQQDEFSFSTLPTADIPLGTSTNLAITWLKEGTPFAGGNVTFTSSRGIITSPNVVTDASGQAMVSIQSNNAGISSISAEGIDGDGNVVSSRAQIEFIASNAATIFVDGTPDSIGPDGQTSTITAVVRDATGNLVKGQTVNFSLNDVSGGFVSPNSATTDGSGIATTVYTSNVVSSQDTVVITATVASDIAISGETLLTVGNRAFDITLGTGREVQSPDASSYLKEFAVFVSDANSNPVANATLTVSATPVKFSLGGEYRKGRWIYDSVNDIWIVDNVDQVGVSCPNEDVNANGILDAGEDTNGDGNLTPGNVAVASNQIVTDDNGQATVEIRYPKQFGPWVSIELRVSGQSAGSEATESQNFRLTVAASDLTDEASPPPSNPFGQGSLCTDTL